MTTKSLAVCAGQPNNVHVSRELLWFQPETQHTLSRALTGDVTEVFIYLFIFIYYYSTEGPKATYTVGESTRSEKHM